MVTLEKAVATRTKLEAKLFEAKNALTEMDRTRISIAFAAHTGGEGAKAALDKMNRDRATRVAEIETIEAALAEAQRRVDAAESEQEAATLASRAERALEIGSNFVERGRKREPHLTKEQAFAKAYSDPENAALVKAERAANGFRTNKVYPPTASIEPIVAVTDGLAELRRMAEDLRQKFPFLTPAAAFAKVYADPANIELRRRERKSAYRRMGANELADNL